MSEVPTVAAKKERGKQQTVQVQTIGAFDGMTASMRRRSLPGKTSCQCHMAGCQKTCSSGAQS